MPKTARANRRANERRRKEAEAKQKPLPIEEQRQRAALRAAEHAASYPVPPTYEDQPNRSKPVRLLMMPVIPGLFAAAALRLWIARIEDRKRRSSQ